MAEIHPCSSLELRPIRIPTEPKDMTIGDTLKLVKARFVYPTNRRHIVAHDEDKGPSEAVLTTRLEHPL